MSALALHEIQFYNCWHALLLSAWGTGLINQGPNSDLHTNNSWNEGKEKQANTQGRHAAGWEHSKSNPEGAMGLACSSSRPRSNFYSHIIHNRQKMETTQMFISWQMVKQNVVYLFVVVIVQSLSCIWFFVTPWIAARQAPLSFTISQSLLKFMVCP